MRARGRQHGKAKDGSQAVVIAFGQASLGSLGRYSGPRERENKYNGVLRLLQVLLFWDVYRPFFSMFPLRDTAKASRSNIEGRDGQIPRDPPPP